MQSFKNLGNLLHLDDLMKQLNRNDNSLEQFFLRCHLVNEDAATDSKPSAKWLLQKAQYCQAKSIKTDLLHKPQRKQMKVFPVQTNEESHSFMEICKLSQKKLGN